MSESSLASDSALYEIDPETRSEIDEWVRKFPSGCQRSALLFALRRLQEQEGGSLTTPMMDALARYLDLPNIAVYEVATFYKMYDLKPVGRYKLKVCNSISCMLRGSEEILEHLERSLSVHPGETSSDGMFTVQEVECLAACVGAPVMQINDRDCHERLTVGAVDVLLGKLRKDAECE